MSVPLTINGVVYSYPTNGQSSGWGAQATAWATAVTSGMLQKSGGTFTLTADADFGASFGLIAEYYKSNTANIGSTGEVRLARADTIVWRNQANSGNLPLGVNSSNQLTFNSVQVITQATIPTSQDLLIGGTTPSALAVGQENMVLTVRPSSGTTIGWDFPRLFTNNINSSISLTSSGAVYLVTTGSAWTLSLLAPASAGKGWHCYIKDQTGTANVNNITVSRAAGGNINGSASNYVINTSYGTVHLVCDGSNWYTI